MLQDVDRTWICSGHFGTDMKDQRNISVENPTEPQQCLIDKHQRSIRNFVCCMDVGNLRVGCWMLVFFMAFRKKHHLKTFKTSKVEATQQAMQIFHQGFFGLKWKPRL